MSDTLIMPIRLTGKDKEALRELAQTLQMNRCDLIRTLVRESYAILQEQSAQASPQATARPRGKRGAKKAMPHEWRKAN